MSQSAEGTPEPRGIKTQLRREGSLLIPVGVLTEHGSVFQTGEFSYATTPLAGVNAKETGPLDDAMLMFEFQERFMKRSGAWARVKS